MSFGPQVVMPGAFHFEAVNGGTSLSGVHPGLFRPPISPSASSSFYLNRSTGSLYSDASTPGPNAKRKRARATESTPLNSWAASTTDARFTTDDAQRERSDANRWAGEGEGRYVLAGQIQTPNGVISSDIQDEMEDSVYSDVNYRRALASKRPFAEVDSPDSRHRAAAESLSLPIQARYPNGWGSFALSTIGGVVGKVFQFWGGKGYEMRTSPERQSPSDGQVWCNEHDIPTLPSFEYTTPSEFPLSDYSPYYYERESTPESTPPPAAKRRQINDRTPGDELRRNWVMVQEPALKPKPQSMASRAPTSYQPQQQSFPPVIRRRMSRPVSRANTRVSTPGITRQQSSRISHAGSASLSNREPASFASPRAQSPVTSHTPSRIPVPSRPQSPDIFSPARLSQQPSFIPSPSVPPKRSHRRNHSTASVASVTSGRVRKRESLQDLKDNSPRLDAEAKNLAAKRLHEEMVTDLRISDFNARLMDMIRQGKEALGTTVEVEAGRDNLLIDPWEDDKLKCSRHRSRPADYGVTKLDTYRLVRVLTDPNNESHVYSPIRKGAKRCRFVEITEIPQRRQAMQYVDRWV
ncbi:hypothetical protein F4677DRAFT_455687 [Hypoxylon crocopeplum]|nr:hypothetical protein F4677DRAFT_455687 [Hypoxylon crocopeplum]